jgi:hypothetical protein
MFAVMMKGMVAHLRGDNAAAASDLQRVADFHNRIHTAVSAFLPPTNQNVHEPSSRIPTASHPHPFPQPSQIHQVQTINLLNFSSPLFSRRTTVTSQSNEIRAPPI